MNKSNIQAVVPPEFLFPLIIGVDHSYEIVTGSFFIAILIDQYFLS